MDTLEAVGTVCEWLDDGGWGAIESPELPSHCWVHYSVVQVPGFRALRLGQSVTFRYRAGVQNGYAFVATEVWPEGADRSCCPPPPASTPSAAYSSELTISFDKPDE